MTGTTNNVVHEHGKLRRFAAHVAAWFQTLDYTSFDYTQDRIDQLERKLAGLTQELRKLPASGPRGPTAL